MEKSRDLLSKDTIQFFFYSLSYAKIRKLNQSPVAERRSRPFLSGTQWDEIRYKLLTVVIPQPIKHLLAHNRQNKPNLGNCSSVAI